MTKHAGVLDWILSPSMLHSVADLRGDPWNPPQVPGVYGWYFDGLPKHFPIGDCHKIAQWVLAYIGISPTTPPKNGGPPSSQHLRARILSHFGGNAAGSTLRLSLGCLMADQLGISLRRVRSGRMMDFGAGEESLSAWMAVHARVVWCASTEPWLLESQLLERLSLPINLQGNRRHPYYPQLSKLRKVARDTAKRLPILT